MSLTSTIPQHTTAIAEAVRPNAHFSNFTTGRIGLIAESVHKPVATALNETLDPRERGAELTEVLQGLRGRPFPGRPFVVVEPPTEPDGPAMICLLTTFGGQDLAELDHAMQHFAVPAGSAMAPYGDVSPLEIKPCWHTPNQFIICAPMPLDWRKKPMICSARADGAEWYQLTLEDQKRLADQIEKRRERLNSMSMQDLLDMRDSYLANAYPGEVRPRTCSV